MNELNQVYKKYFSPDNLRLAWERMIRSFGKDVKDFFGIEIYTANLDKNLMRLSDAIINGEFQPQRPFKYYEPKPTKTHRTKTVLCIEDALVYQAIADTIATSNYKKLADNNSFVFGSVLHSEVERGLRLLAEPDADFYFFEYYIPLYNKFINSVNTEIENIEIQFKLETDITGFFDCIPHSKLLMSLNNLGVEPEILDLLGICLNLYSGTKESITPGVGIPQGPAPSFLLANIFLNDLDYLLSQNGYTYYRYMDDIRIYEETEEKLTEALVLIDNYLKGKALSLNTKKTSIELLGENREAEKMPILKGYGEILPDYTTKHQGKSNQNQISIIEQRVDNDQDNSYIIRTIEGQDLIEYCQKEVAEVEQYLNEKFRGISKHDFDPRKLATNEKIKKDIIQIAYRWRSSNTILKQIDKPILKPELIPIWLFCVEHFFWKSNHFCWNLNQYGPDVQISSKLRSLLPKFKIYEWVQYQILSNLAGNQCYSNAELKEFFRKAKVEPSALVRLGYFMILFKHLKPESQLFASLRQAVKDDKETYIRRNLAGFLSHNTTHDPSNEIKFWFGL